MKACLVALALLLTTATLRAKASEEVPKKLITCCVSFVTRRIPFTFLESYSRTSSQCFKPGIIFLTKKKRQVCADPGAAWVRDYTSRLDPKPRLSGSPVAATTQGL